MGACTSTSKPKETVFNAVIRTQSQRVRDTMKPVETTRKTFDPVPNSNTQPKIILDTDIGSDVDDSMSLLMLMHISTDEYTLLGIVTVSSSVEIRKAVAEAILKEKNDQYFSNIPVIAGISAPRRVEKSPSCVEAGFILDKNIIEDLKKKSSDEFLPIRKPIEWYKNTLENLPDNERATIICIGPLTNIAQLYTEYPEIARKKIEKLVILGGSLCSGLDKKSKKQVSEMEIGSAYLSKGSFNLQYDVPSAHLVISKAHEWSQQLLFITHEATASVCLNSSKLDRFLSMEEPAETKLVVTLAKKYLEIRKMLGRSIVPHDTIAVLEAISPCTVCEYKRGWFYIDEITGNVAFIPDPENGSDYGTATINSEQFLNMMLEMLEKPSHIFKP